MNKEMKELIECCGEAKYCETKECKDYVKAIKEGKGQWAIFKTELIIKQVMSGVYGTKHRSALLLHLEELKEVLKQ